ncbi:signal recognition particle-docking protein FtsY [Candidatus Woesearchaeota archaeon]|nr:signal recognition particle-docking protein FtsY [Candidatus Woesearchaeota archaeon]
MFKFLKEKLKKTVDSFSKKVDEEAEEVPQEEVKEEESLEESTEENSRDVGEESVEYSKELEEKEELVLETKEEIQEEKELEEELSKTKIVEEKVEEEKPVQELVKEVLEIPVVEEEVVEAESTEDIYDEEDREEQAEDSEISSIEEGFVEGFEKDEGESFEDSNQTEIVEDVVEEPVPEETEDLKFEEEVPYETESPQEIIEEEPVVEKEEKVGFFQKLMSKKLDENKFEDLFWDLEIILLENNVSVEVIEKIKEDLKKSLVDQSFKKSKILDIIQETLKNSLHEILNVEKIDVMSKIESKKPFVICFFGINGSGKTTTIAKFTNMLLKKNKSVVLAAADTFRAAAIDQIQEHADKLDVKLIKHDYGSDPAAVAFDAIKHAESKGIDVVLVDTAGRLHSNANLLDEMKKIIRIANPDMKIFVGESITGNDCVEQASNFNEAVGIDGVILSKADIDEKGGASISVGYVTGKPILYIGTGQEYDDFEEFDAEKVLDRLEL